MCITGVMIDCLTRMIPVYNVNGECDGCAEELEDSWRFCPYCGSPINYQNEEWGKINWRNINGKA